MADQTPMVNGADSRSPSAPMSKTYSAPSNHPLGPSCTICKKKHRRCDRTQPVCETCQSMGAAAECSYPSVLLPVTANNSTGNRIKQKTGAALSGPMFNSSSPATGEKRPRPTNSSSERTGLVNTVVGVPIESGSSYHQTETPLQSPAKQQKISKLGPGSRAKQSVLGRGQVTPVGARMPRESGPNHPHRIRSISPMLHEDEMELRCNLTTEINVLRMEHRYLTSESLRKILKLLKKAKIERPEPETVSTEATISPLGDTQLNNDWREEDDLIEAAIVKLERGGRCSRALLSRFEMFLYGPLMSHEEKKIQERVMCVEECLSSTSTEPTFNHNELFLHRLSKVTSSLDAYGLDDKDSRIGLLRNHLLTAISTNSKLSRKDLREFAELLDPDGSIARANLEDPGVKVETAASERKLEPKPTFPAPTDLPSSRSRSPSSTHFASSPFPSSSIPPPSSPSHPSLSTQSLESIDLTDDTLIPVTNPECKITKLVASIPCSQSSQSNDTTVSPVMQSAPKERPAFDRGSLCSEVPKRLWSIFVANHAPLLPMLNIDQLKIDFAFAVSHGKVTPTGIKPTLGMCIAIASQLARDKELWVARKWYDAAISNMADPLNQTSKPSIQFFHHRILQTHYLQIVGQLLKAQEILALAIARAESLGMPTTTGGSLVKDDDTLEQVRMVWQCLWTKKLSLNLQCGIFHQSLDTFYEFPMPMQSFIQENLGVSGASLERRRAASSFFIVCASLSYYTDELITVENDLRVTRMECPIKWLSVVDLRGFQELNAKLSSWKSGLPDFLEWKDPGIKLAMEKDPLIRCISAMAHLRFVYLRLREYRPFFILTLRLSQPCACEMSPHITGKDIDLLNGSPFLGLVFYSAVKCLIAAKDIVKTLTAYDKHALDEHAKCENLEYLYAAAVILIAARSVPHVMSGTRPGMAADTMAPGSVTTNEELREIDTLLRSFEASCEQAPRLKSRVERVRAVLDHIKLQSVSSNGLLTDDRLRFKSLVWQNIYGRLGLELPFDRFRLAPESTVPGRRMTLGWMESLPMDVVHGN